MAVSQLFEDEIQAIDGAVSLVYDTAASGYERFEWSYSGSGDVYTILGGSERAAQHGAAMLLEALGFRFYGDGDDWTKRPVSITRNLSAAKQDWWMNSNRIWYAYNSAWGGGYDADSTAFATTHQNWQTLTGMGPQSPAPAGHRWDGIIENNVTGSGMSMSNRAWFTANPQYVANPEAINTSGFGNPTFQLDGSLSAGEYDTLVNVVAGSLLRDTSEINEFDRTSFDAEDGSLATSDQVFDFAKDVVDRCRTGTSAAGNHPARAGIADLQLGLYAYAGHREPPSGDDYSGLFCQVALGFSTAGYASFADLVQAHANVGFDFIGLREYLDVGVWALGQPCVMSTMKANSFSQYPSYKASGADGANCEFQANWIVNVVGTRHLVNLLRTGTGTYTDALDEVMADIFDDEPTIRDLYELWSDPNEKWHLWNLKQTFDIIDSMPSGTWKTYFKYCAVIWYEMLTLPEQQTAAANPSTHKTASDPFWVKFPVLMSHIWAIRNLNLLHSYMLVRRFANGAVATNYPELRYNNTQLFFDEQTAAFTVGTTVKGATSGRKGVIKAIVDNGTSGHIWTDATSAFTDNELLNIVTGSSDTIVTAGIARVNGTNIRPDWWANPVLPNDTDFSTYHAALTAGLAREDDLDDPDLVMLHNITPLAGADKNDSTKFNITGSADFQFIGPGTVIQTGEVPIVDDDGEPTGQYDDVDFPVPYPAGRHTINTNFNNAVVSHTGGNLFLDCFYQVRRNTSDETAEYWLYIPNRVDGAFNMYTVNNTRLKDDTHSPTQVDVTATSDPSEFQDLGPGQIQYDNGNSNNNTFGITNGNRYMSLKKNKALVPRVFVEEDFPAIGKILKA